MARNVSRRQNDTPKLRPILARQTGHFTKFLPYWVEKAYLLARSSRAPLWRAQSNHFTAKHSPEPAPQTAAKAIATALHPPNPTCGRAGVFSAALPYQGAPKRGRPWSCALFVPIMPLLHYQLCHAVSLSYQLRMASHHAYKFAAPTTHLRRPPRAKPHSELSLPNGVAETQICSPTQHRKPLSAPSKRERQTPS